MIVLDTNVVSELMKFRPNARVTAWTNGQAAGQLFVAAPTVFEIEFGIERLKKQEFKAILRAGWANVLREIIADRILDLNSAAARHAAEFKAGVTGTRQHADVVDCMIAGIAAANGATLASRNAQHFPRDRIEIIDPWLA